ncbi:MAG: zinc-dependent peptidase [Chitinophagaceae bacterium]|nr:zinc-dependent peptidase [Chitinophagaceae bacterium]
MNATDRLIYLAIIIVFVYVVISSLSKKKKLPPLLSGDVIKNILQQHVLFYQQLDDAHKSLFQLRVESFLQRIRITGVKTTVEDIDRVFAASAAIIPIFHFDGWEYRNLHEILLYPDSFSEEFKQDGEGRNILGMVGTGPMQNVMILSQGELRNGFFNPNDKSNTGIHEFVHLIDKTDGATDGTIEALMPHKYSLPWIKRIHQEIELIKKGRSDINPYGATNEAEFLAVAAEYFFEKPHLMEKKHPELYALLKEIFMPGE